MSEEPGIGGGTEWTEELKDALFIKGDLKGLSKTQRQQFYLAVCQKTGLDPLLRPFDFLDMKEKGGGVAKTILYARKEACDQLIKKCRITITIVEAKADKDAGVFMVKTRASTPDGQFVEATGAVPIVTELWVNNPDVKGERMVKVIPMVGSDFARAIKVAETQAKRRAVLGLTGLGLMDESEIGNVRPGVVQELPAASPTSCQEVRRLALECKIDLPTQLARFGVERVEELNQLQADDLATQFKVVSEARDTVTQMGGNVR